MTQPEFDAQGLFNEDYLHFYAVLLTDRRSDDDTGLIWRLLALEPGLAVLDLACGHGRIANRLAARGCRVTGLDASSLFLDAARRDAAAQGVSVDYVRGDMRALPFTGRFDGVVSWFTSYGYFDDAGLRQVLTEARRVLRPGGRLLIEIQHRDRLMRELRPEVVVERDADLMVDRHHLDPLTSRIVADRILVRDGRVRRVPFFVRLFSFTELRDWLLAAGFLQVDGYGEDGEPLSAESRRMVAVARC